MEPTIKLITWLLDSQIPTIRYRTLIDLLNYPAHDAQVIQARQAIMEKGPVPAILSRQLDNGAWVRDVGYYTPKYQSTHWTLMLLAELDVDGQDEHFQRGVDYMLNAMADEVHRGLAINRLGLSCLKGNILRYALHAKRWDDWRVQQLIEYTVKDVNHGPCQCQYNDGYACAWGAVRSLWGLSAIPAQHRTHQVDDAIERGIEFLLDTYRLVDANYPTPDGGKVHTLWSKLSFPLFYQADILFTLRVLGELNALNRSGAQPALAWLRQRRQQNGRWRGSSPYRRRTWPELGERAETNRWVSLYAAGVLNQANMLSPRMLTKKAELMPVEMSL